MLTDSPTPEISIPFSPDVVKKLQLLEKKRKQTESRMLLWLIAPVLWALPVLLEWMTNWSWLSIFEVVWIFIVLFGLGTYIHVVLPSNEDISKAYKKTIIPDLLRIAGAEGDYSLTHGLKVDSFLKSGLYHDDYSHFERADSIIGKFKNVKFGLYELAVQVSTTFKMVGNIGAQQRVLTNMFYGWVLHVPVRTLLGNTYIIPAKQKASGETDDWIKKTTAYCARNFSIYKSGDANFEAAFLIYTTHPAEAEKILQKPFRDFLILVLSQSANAPGFSFTGNRAAMHLGISDSAFDRQAGQIIYPAGTEKLLKKIRFFCAMSIALHAAANS
jgi:hypothetical protein